MSDARLRGFVALLLVALGSAAFAIAFRASVHSASQLLFGTGNLLDVLRRLHWWECLLLSLSSGVLAWGVLGLSARFKQSASVGKVMEAVAIGRGTMSAPATAFKALASWIAMGGGASIGREGPLIQFGGALGSSLSRWFSLDGKQHRALVAAGTAAGFAAAYNTPLAAMLFMVEVVAGVITLDVLVPAAVATALASTLTRWAIGEGPIYGARAFRLVNDGELLAFAVLGLLAGVVGAGFIKLLNKGEQTAGGSSLSLLPKILLGALGVGLIAIALPEVAGNGFEPLSELLSGKMPLTVVVALLLAKPLATTLSVSSGLPGGVFTPTLLVGACLGALYGNALNLFAEGHVAPATAYALVGLAALCAATTHAPIMAAVLGFELSGDYAIVLPLVLSSACAVWVSERLHSSSLYETELQRRGLAWHEAPGERRLVRNG